MKTRLTIALLLLAALLAALAVALLRRPPASPAARDPLSIFSARCEAVAVLPDVGRAGERLGALARSRLAGFAASTLGLGSGDALLGELSRQAGFDPRRRESLREVGLDPAGPLAVFLPPGGPPIAALPTSDPGKLEALLARLAADRAGATRRAESKGGARPIVTFSAPAAPGPSLAYAEAKGFLLACAGPRCPDALGGALAAREEDSLSREPRFAALRRDLEGEDAYVFLCPESPRAQRLDLLYGAGAGLSLGPDELRLSVEVPLAEAQARALASLSQPAGADLVPRLAPGAFALARMGGDPRLLAPLAARLLPRSVQADADLLGEVLANLKPGVAASLSLSPQASLATTPDFDPRRTNPFQYVQLSAIGRVADEARAAAALESLAALAPRLGARMEAREVEGTRVLVTRYALGEGASIALRAGQVLVTGGPGQMEALLARLASGAAPALQDAKAGKALAEEGFALFVDLRQLWASLRGLPDSAYGVGGFAIKAAVARYLDALEDLKGVRLSGRVDQGRLRAELALSAALSPAPGKEPKPP